MARDRRINFNVQEEERLRVDHLMSETRMATQRDLFMAALDLFERVHREVRSNHRAILAIPASLAGIVATEVARRSGQSAVLAEPETGGWRWLVSRPGWMATPWVKGRRLHVSDVVRLVNDAASDVHEVAEDLRLPQEAISECLAYYEANRDLVDAERIEATRRSRKAVEEVRDRLGLHR